MIHPETRSVGEAFRRQRKPLLITIAVAVVLAAAPWVWSWATTATSDRALAKANTVHRLADLPIYPGASPDPFASPSGRGPVQTAIYLTSDSPDQVKAFYRKRLSLPDDMIRELPGTWVTDLPKTNGDRLTIQAEGQPEGQGTRLSMILVHATP